MKQTDREQALRRLAARYAQEDGKRLLAELQELERTGVRYPAPLLREKVQRGMARPRGRRGWMAALAACVLLVLLVPALLRWPAPDDTSQGTADAGGDAWQEEAADEEAQLEAAADDALDSAVTEAQTDILPLRFALPENLSVSEADYDNGRTIYHLEDAFLDDVVLTMELAEEFSFEGLLPLELNGAAAFASTGPDYQLLTFEKEEILYVLTCRYDINTLTRLGVQIL